MSKHIFNWVVITLAVFVSAYILPGVYVSSFWIAFIVAMILGVVNTFLKPILLILTLPLNIMTLGFFTLILNALLVKLVDYLVIGFVVTGFWWAMLFSLLVSALVFALQKAWR